MSGLWTDLAKRLQPYTPGEQPKGAGVIKLNTNENPKGPSPHALEAIRDAASSDLRLYPDPRATDLRDALARYHGVEPGQVFVGNGSDEVLAHAFAALLKHDLPLLMPDIGYGFYPVYCRLFGIDRRAVPLDDRFEIAVDAYRQPAGGLILANPNAPTGIALKREQIRNLLHLQPTVPVVIDEAYVDFGAETAIPLVRQHANLLVVRTMSKSRSLAGLRVGYAIGDAALIDALERVKDSFNSYPVGRLAQAGAIASVRDEPYFRESCGYVIENRSVLETRLGALGFEVLPSAANFVFARHPAHAGAVLAAALRARQVLVRHFPSARIENFIRITVGTAMEVDHFVSILADVLASTEGQP